MRIAAVSDIHARPNGVDNDLLRAIRERVTEFDPDVFIIAGDMNEQIKELEHNLSKVRVDGCKNLYVSGNHDIWFEEDKGIGSLEKYSHLMKEACERSGFVHLPDEPCLVEDIAFIGSIGWYDYSFRCEDLDIPLENYEMKQYRDSYWRDLYCIDWSLTDVEATSLLNQKLIYDLETLPESVKCVVYISHHLPFLELTLYKDRLPWDFFSAFMGAVSSGEILKQDSRVVLSISGHSHIRSVLKLDSLMALTVPVGYGRPHKDDLDSFVDSAIAEIIIRDNEVELLHFVEGDLCQNLPYSFG